MAERRALTEGLTATPPPIDAGIEKKFVYRDKAPAENAAFLSRVPISTRIRSDFAVAL